MQLGNVDRVRRSPSSNVNEEEKADARRARIRRNVQAFRARQRAKKALAIKSLLESSANYETLARVDSQPDAHSPQSRELALTKYDEDLLDDQSDDEVAISVPPEISPVALHRESIINALQKFLPSQRNIVRLQYDPVRAVTMNAAGWLSTSPFNYNGPSAEVLMPALTSSALVILGKETDNRDLLMNGLKMQGMVLHRLGKELQRVQKGDSMVSADALRLTMMCVAISELLGNNSWIGAARHLQGVAAIVESLGVKELTTDEKREGFYGFRRLQAALSFAFDLDSFLARPEWIHLPWKAEVKSAQQPYQLLLDMVLPLLPILSSNKTRLQPQTLAELESLLQRLKRIEFELDTWHTNFESTYKEAGNTLYHTRPAAWTGLYEEGLDFTDQTGAVAIVSHAGFRIKLAAIMSRVYDRLAKFDARYKIVQLTSRVENLTWARLACRGCEYFYDPEASMIPRIVSLVPFDVAWETYFRLHAEASFDLSREIKWCEEVAVRFKNMGVSVIDWRSGSLMP